MGHLGCINLTQLPLQIVLHKNPQWNGHPVAVIKEEKPTSHLMYVNHAAQEKGVHVGTRYSEALSLLPHLRAGTVSDKDILETREGLVRIINNFTPDIELCLFDTDAIWVNVSGMRSLFVSSRQWIIAVRKALFAEGYRARIAIGYTRIGTYAVSRSSSKSVILNSLEEEQASLSQSPLSVFPLSPRTTRLFTRLGVKTLRDFMALPIDGTLKRFGNEAKALLSILHADQKLSLQPMTIEEPISHSKRFDSPLFTQPLIMEHIEYILEQALSQARSNSKLIAALILTLKTEDGTSIVEHIRPAKPCQNQKVLARLIGLRLANKSYTAGIEEVCLDTTNVAPSHEQHDFFGTVETNINAGAQAFALIRARLGNDSITVAQIADSHLPEKTFSWNPIEQPPPVPDAEPTEIKETCAIRRIFRTPKEARYKPSRRNLSGGPFIISGAWWEVTEISPFSLSREYYFYARHAGEVAWMYTNVITQKTYTLGFVD